MLTKNSGYFSNAEAAREPFADSRAGQDNSTGRNPRDVWAFNTKPTSIELCKSCGAGYTRKELKALSGGKGRDKICVCGASDWHRNFALFPLELPTRCIRASISSVGVCAICGDQYAPVVERKNMEIRRTDYGKRSGNRIATSGTMIAPSTSRVVDYKPTCNCAGSTPVPATVLDPMSGCGTTLMAAMDLGCNAIGVELNPLDCALTVHRLGWHKEGRKV